MNVQRALVLAAAGLSSLLVMPSDANAAKPDCQALARAGQKDEALDCYRARVKKNPNDHESRNAVAALLADQKKYQSALAEFDEVLKRSAKDGVALNGKAMMLIALKRTDEGLKVLQRAIELDPKNIQALHNLALMNFSHGHFDHASTLWHRVLKVEPDEPDALVGLGEILMRQGKLEEALSYFKKVIAKNDRHPRALYLAGKTIAQSRPVEAIPYLELAASLLDDAEAWYDLGLVRIFAGEWHLAGQALTQAMKLAPDDYRIYLELGKVHLELRRVDDAIAHFDEVLKLNPPPHAKVTVRFHMALVREAQGRKKDAADEYLQTLAMDPSHVGAMLNLAVLYLEEKRWDEAKVQLEKAVRIAPTNSNARFNLGKLLLTQGKIDAGKTELEAVVAARPENDPLHQKAKALLEGVAAKPAPR